MPQFRAAIIFVYNESNLTRNQVWTVMNDDNSKILPEVSRRGFVRSCLKAKRDVLRIDITGQIPDLPPQPDLRLSREAGVMRIPARGALKSLISLFLLLLLVGCCQFFRGSDDVVSFTISPLNMSIQPGKTQQFVATGTFGLGDTGDVTSRVKWASSNTALVTIDSTGLATAIAYGTVTIYGTCECYPAQTNLAVVNQTAAISSITVTPQTPKITGVLTQHLSRQQPTRIAPIVSLQTRLNVRQLITQVQ